MKLDTEEGRTVLVWNIYPNYFGWNNNVADWDNKCKPLQKEVQDA